MKKLFKSKSILVVLLVTLIASSCSSEDNEDLGIKDPEIIFDAELFVSEAGNDSRTVMATVDATTGNTIKSKVKFTTTTNAMRRLYITHEVNGAGAEPYVFTSQEVDEKADGSLDLVGDNKKTFEFQIDLPAPAMNGGDIVYTFWATTGRGDFRDVSKRNAIDDTALGTITVSGTGSNTGSDIREFTAVILAAPLADGTSETFLSLYNSTVYKISEGEETAALWDFGYFFGATAKASFSSTKNYPDTIINVPTVSGVADAELNTAYFALSSSSAAFFDAITNSSELDGIVQPTSQTITDLKVGDVIDIVDQYGKKGKIKVTGLVSGFGTDGKITFTVKIQA